MAGEDIVFKAKVEEEGKSLSALKKEFKELQAELNGATKGTEQYRAALQKLGGVRDEIEDLNEEINAFKGGSGQINAFTNVAQGLAGGFQAATGAAALFGVQTEEVEQALLKVQAAAALTDGLKAIESMGQSMQVLGNVIKTNVVSAFATLKGAIIATGIGALVVAIGVLIYKTQEYNEALEEEFDKQRRLNEELKKTTDEYLKQAAASEELRNRRQGGLNELERELKLLEASGATAEQIAAKKQAIIDNEIYNLKVRRATVEGNAEVEAEITQKILDKEAEKQAVILAFEKQKRDEALKTAEEKRKLAEKESEEERQRQVDAYNREADLENAKIDKEAEAKEKEKERLLEEDEAFKQAILDGEVWLSEQDQKAKDDLDKRRKEDTAKELAAIEVQRAAKVQATNQALNAASSLSNAYFASQLKNAKGNAAEELKIRKKQFEVDKAFAISRAVIDGIRSVQAAMTIPPPAGQILAAVNAIAAAANVAKIASTSFEGGNAGDINSPSSQSSGPVGPIQITPPQINQQPTTRLDENGNNLSLRVKAEVVETEMTSKQNRVTRLENQASIG